MLIRHFAVSDAVKTDKPEQVSSVSNTRCSILLIQSIKQRMSQSVKPFELIT